LTLADGSDGRLLLHCKKSACAFADILAAAGVAPGSYTPPDPATIAQRERAERAEAEKRARQARAVWDASLPIGNSPAETYLRGRGITCAMPSTLRFHPEAWHGPTARRHPALVAMIEGAEGFAVHRTYMRPDGTGKARIEPAKAMLGATAGGAVRLTCGPGPLLIGEGIESSLSARILLGDLTVSAWAALSTSGMRGLRLPKVGESGKMGRGRPSLILAVDGENAGREAGRELAERAFGLGWQVGILDPGDGADFNDRLIEGARHEHV
jgi:hypothetical protein